MNLKLCLSKISIIEKLLFFAAIIFYSLTNKSFIFYVPFSFVLISSLVEFYKTRENRYIFKIILYSLIIPSNYIIILVISVLYVCLIAKFKRLSKRIFTFFLLIIINLLINDVRVLNLVFGLLYLLPNVFVYDSFEKLKETLRSSMNYIVEYVIDIINIQIAAILIYFIFNYEWIINGIANDWIVGTFGYHQGNILLFFLIFSFLLLFKEAVNTKKIREKIYCVLIILVAIFTNSISLLIAFFVSFVLISFIYSNKREKKIVLIVGIIFASMFLLFTPKWIKNYIVRLTDYSMLTTNVPKIAVYEDTYFNIPSFDFKFLFFGNGIGEYSSRAALTCTGRYISKYNDFFDISVSNYTQKYILNRYVEYNLIDGYGTLYSPFSTMITIRGEYGIIGLFIFLLIILSLLKRSNKYSKIFIIFFVLSCFIENYLEFAKVITMLVMLYYLNQNDVDSKNGRKKNIMFIVPTLCGGGAEKTVANLSKYLIKDYNIDIVVFKDTNVKYSYDGNLIILNKKRNTNMFKKGLFFFKALFKIKKLKIQRNIDYAISFLTPADILNVLTKVENCKTIISIRNTDSILTGGTVLKIITKISCKSCDHIVSISNQVKDDIINNFGIKKEKITTIYNPSLKISFSHNQALNTTLFSNNHIVINVGRLADQKGQWHLIRAFSLVVSEIKDARLIILGQGPLKEYLQSLIDDYGMESNITLLGFVDNPYDYMEKSDCFVFSSLYEGLGNSLLEAMACNLPIISCDCVSGPREILSPNSDYRDKVKNDIDFAEYGILVPVCDGKMRSANEPLTSEEKLLAEAIKKILLDKNLIKKYKELSIKRNKDFDIIKIVNNWKLLLERK